MTKQEALDNLLIEVETALAHITAEYGDSPIAAALAYGVVAQAQMQAKLIACQPETLTKH